jgi:hypothetical protein
LLHGPSWGFHSRYQDKEYAAEDAKAWTLDLSNEIKVGIKQENRKKKHGIGLLHTWVFMGVHGFSVDHLWMKGTSGTLNFAGCCSCGYK